MRALRIVACVLCLTLGFGRPARADTERPASVTLGSVEWTTDVASAPVMPGERLSIALQDPANREWTLSAPGGRTTRLSARKWTWRAPDAPGIVTAHLTAAGEDEASVELTLLVMVPAFLVSKDGRLNGYRIGAYPAKPLRGDPLYLPPKGFVEVTDDNDEAKVSPRFRLGQFTSKQTKEYPKFVVIDPRLIVRLEQLADSLEARDKPSKLHIMSGYRTPFYNRAIENVRYSLHQWGAAADVFVDDDRDGRMDDLNGDKQIDRNDAIMLFSIANTLGGGNARQQPYAGGLGIYGATAAHGPFVHIDVRGRVARW